MAWFIGNTTVRTPYRLRDALIVLSGSPFVGNLAGRDSEQGFAELLHREGVVAAERVASGQTADDLGRKWRSALTQLGFVTPALTRGLRTALDPKLLTFTAGQVGLTGRPFEITESGRALIAADQLPAQQECFLRALASFRLPSVLMPRHTEAWSPFSPLRFTLEVLVALGRAGEEAVMSFNEMAVIVQNRTPADGADVVTGEVIAYRRERLLAPNKRGFDRERLLAAVGRECPKATVEERETKANTLVDYADLSLRYLKATGLVMADGKGITCVPEKASFINGLLGQPFAPRDDREYLHSLWKGARLPTDSPDMATAVVRSLAADLQARGEEAGVPDLGGLSVQDLSNIRHGLEEQIERLNEREYAVRQKAMWAEIVGYLKACQNPRRRHTAGDEVISIPRDEAPAYFEWAIWRAFLAINSLRNEPWESRLFRIDRSFLPVCHAPGGGPDLLFEFDNFVLVVEVTFTDSSRQEAAEGEPVRRHVADAVRAQAGGTKEVYGLFIAVRVDSNTAETFRSGSWYLPDDKKVSLDIVPVTLEDFTTLFEAGCGCGAISPQLLRDLLVVCRSGSNRDAPEWKSRISQAFRQMAERLRSATPD